MGFSILDGVISNLDGVICDWPNRLFRRGMMKPFTWGDIFLKWLRKGVDPAYAAWMADKWQKRKARK